MWSPVDYALVVSTAALTIAIFNYLMVMHIAGKLNAFLGRDGRKKPVEKIGFIVENEEENV